MNPPLPILTDEELRRLPSAVEDSGFGSLQTPRGHLPLKALNVQARIDGLLVRLELRQTFVNNLGEPLEATYIFPLPDRAAVTRFRMTVGGRVIEGELKERGVARREYDDAIQAGQRAAITEEERPGVFTLRVGNLMPGEEATVSLTLAGPLPYADGEATFRFPLVVAPRYIPGTPLSGPSVGAGTEADTDAVPDASRISPPVLLPGYPNPVRLALSVAVHSGGLPLQDLRCSLHTAVTEEDGEGGMRVTLQPGERLDRDFILRFRLDANAVQTSLRLEPDVALAGQREDTPHGTFVLTLVPPTEQARSRRPRDVVFVLDRSGSMSGWKIVAARRALARMVDTLTERDRFTVYAFDNTIETPPEFGGLGLVPASDRQRYRAVEFLAKIDARGGTEMAQPLDQGVQALTDGTRERILVLITDGQVGNEDQILKHLGPRLRELRVFALGIDQAVNAAFLRRLADLGGGACELVESEDRLDEVMASIHRRIDTPLLTGLRLERTGGWQDLDAVVPGRLPDLFAGAPVTITGRYRGTASGGLILLAQDAGGQPWAATVEGVRSGGGAAAVVWARGYLRELEDRYVISQGNREELEKQIVSLSLRFGVLCRFTAFMAVDRSETVNPGGQVQSVVQPVEMPREWAAMRGVVPAACQPGHIGYASLARPVPFGFSFKDVSRRAAKAIFGSVMDEAAESLPVESAPAPVDVTPLRQRAAELLQELRSLQPADAAERWEHLRQLAEKLAKLVQAIQVAGSAEGRELEKVLKRIRQQLTRKRRQDAESVSLWAQLEAVLAAFAGSATPPPSAKRDEFWK
jgi:Ca-activated chloride channel family protein